MEVVLITFKDKFENLTWKCKQFSNLVSQKVNLSILLHRFTKHLTSVVVASQQSNFLTFLPQL